MLLWCVDKDRAHVHDKNRRGAFHVVSTVSMRFSPAEGWDPAESLLVLKVSRCWFVHFFPAYRCEVGAHVYDLSQRERPWLM